MMRTIRMNKRQECSGLDVISVRCERKVNTDFQYAADEECMKYLNQIMCLQDEMLPTITVLGRD
jgi:hypothetical protein